MLKSNHALTKEFASGHESTLCNFDYCYITQVECMHGLLLVGRNKRPVRFSIMLPCHYYFTARIMI